MAWTSYAVSIVTCFGAVGYPRCPEPYFAVRLLIPIRRVLQRYVSLRPVRLLPGIDSPLKNFPPGQTNVCRVRENIAHPVAQIRSGAMMLQHLGQRQAAMGVEKAFEVVLAKRAAQTSDLGGKASTGDVGDAVPQEISVAEP